MSALAIKAAGVNGRGAVLAQDGEAERGPAGMSPTPGEAGGEFSGEGPGAGAEEGPEEGGGVINPVIIAPPEGSLDHFQLSPGAVTHGEVEVSYAGIAGNQPQAYQNTIALWASSAPRPIDTPLKTFQFPSNRQPDRIVLDYPFQAENYALTWSVGPDPTRMCALAPLALFRQAAEASWPRNVALKLRSVTAGAIELSYTVLPGYRPHTYANWIGLWQGIETAYGAPDPIAQVKIPDDQSEGVIVLPHLSLYTDFNYTLFYFMASPETDPQFTSAAAAIYFST